MKSTHTPHVSPALAADPGVSSADPQDWFKKEVHPHDGQLKAYLRGQFPAVRDVEDVVQESYLRIWRARKKKPIESAKAFLFTIARNIALSSLRRKWTNAEISVRNLEALDVLEDSPSTLEALSRQERIQILGDAIVALPAKTREIFILSKLRQLTHAEISAQTGYSRKTVEYQIELGFKLCEAHVRTRGV